jgi:hypothetical protein
MGLSILSDILNNWDSFELDDCIYIPEGVDIALDLPVRVLPFDPKLKRIFEGQVYLLGIEQLRDAILGLESQLGRAASASERLAAATYYARHDAFIPLSDLPKRDLALV